VDRDPWKGECQPGEAEASGHLPKGAAEASGHPQTAVAAALSHPQKAAAKEFEVRWAELVPRMLSAESELTGAGY